MNFPRYVLAAALSMAIHGALLLTDQEAQAFTMPQGNQSNSVSINFLAQAQPQPQPQPQRQSTTAPSPSSAVEEPRQEKPTPVKPAPAKSEIPREKPQATPPPKLDKTPKPAAVESKSREQTKTEPVEQENDLKSQENNEPTVTNEPSRSGVSEQPPLVQSPSFISRPVSPQYPRLARQRGIEGVALYEVWLDERGQQIKQVLLSSSGAQSLDQSALNAIKQWQFSPYTVNGQTIAHRVQIPVRFKLEG